MGKEVAPLYLCLSLSLSFCSFVAFFPVWEFLAFLMSLVLSFIFALGPSAFLSASLSLDASCICSCFLSLCSYFSFVRYSSLPLFLCLFSCFVLSCFLQLFLFYVVIAFFLSFCLSFFLPPLLPLEFPCLIIALRCF